jgi:hypothetical protein
MTRMEAFREGLSVGAEGAAALDVMPVVEAPAGFPAGTGYCNEKMAVLKLIQSMI